MAASSLGTYFLTLAREDAARRLPPQKHVGNATRHRIESLGFGRTHPQQ
jgi:hypothetical protein